jgi:hypothetical protein
MKYLPIQEEVPHPMTGDICSIWQSFQEFEFDQ